MKTVAAGVQNKSSGKTIKSLQFVEGFFVASSTKKPSVTRVTIFAATALITMPSLTSVKLTAAKEVYLLSIPSRTITFLLNTPILILQSYYFHLYYFFPCERQQRHPFLPYGFSTTVLAKKIQWSTRRRHYYAAKPPLRRHTQKIQLAIFQYFTMLKYFYNRFLNSVQKMNTFGT
ncbi:hypothetical protein [Flavobacterium sp.]|uniref:hypothetical protein n=1 Tax=Flavobacterium sp. TaxID=239 RepID=UPI002614018B|nr:hypothetical protein [Flavobacterium sp.]